MNRNDQQDNRPLIVAITAAIALAISVWAKATLNVSMGLVLRLVAGLPFIVHSFLYFPRQKVIPPRELEVEPETGRLIIPWSIYPTMDEKYSPKTARCSVLLLLIPIFASAVILSVITFEPTKFEPIFSALYPIAAPVADLSGAVKSCLIPLKNGVTDIRRSSFVVNTAICLILGLSFSVCFLVDLKTNARIQYLKRIKHIRELGKSRSILHMAAVLLLFICFNAVFVFLASIDSFDEMYCLPLNDTTSNSIPYELYMFSMFLILVGSISVSSLIGFLFLYASTITYYCSGFSYKDYVIK